MNLTSAFLKSVLICLTVCMLLTVTAVRAQYCSPTFDFGCFSWSNKTVHLDSIDWAVDPYACDLSDYTSYSTTMTAGTTHPMHITNGNWCGCGVWIDLNQDFTFDSTENFFYLYTANETNAYNFTITIPSNVASGTYRMRVVAGWGTDCFSASANGYGACGAYQYGNFDDFTIHVAGIATGTAEAAASNLSIVEAFPNPVNNEVLTVSVRGPRSNDEKLQLCDIRGKMLQTRVVTNEKEMFNVSALPAGVYFIKYINGQQEETIKLFRQ